MTTDERRAVAAHVAWSITESGLTRRAVATASGIPSSTLRRKLAAGSDFSVADIAAIAAALGISPTDLLPH